MELSCEGRVAHLEIRLREPLLAFLLLHVTDRDEAPDAEECDQQTTLDAAVNLDPDRLPHALGELFDGAEPTP